MDKPEHAIPNKHESPDNARVPKAPEVTKPKSSKDQVRSIGDKVTPIYFGVHVERPTVSIFNAVVQDIIAYKSILTHASRLVVVSDSPKLFKRVCASLGIECVDFKTVKAETWKVYYETDESIGSFFPDGATTVYSKKVSNEKGNPQKLVQGDPRYPSLYQPGDAIPLPPGRNPNINKIPPRMPVAPMTPSAPILPLW